MKTHIYDSHSLGISFHITACQKQLVAINLSCLDEVPKCSEQIDPTLLSQVISVIETGIDDKNIKLNLQGTSFQQKVWSALREIPFGYTVSYQQLANKINQPAAYRAVANAVGKNPIGCIIPCHRVIKSNGDLGGFRWGIAIKEKLLEREGIIFR